MAEATRILNAIEQGDSQAAQQLAHEKPGQTLGATALVHEAYLRLVGDQQFANRRHFFAAAVQAMRRILIESARRKQLIPRVDFAGLDPALADDRRLLELNDALERLAAEEPMAAKIPAAIP